MLGVLAYLYLIHLSKQTWQCFIYFIECISAFLKKYCRMQPPTHKKIFPEEICFNCVQVMLVLNFHITAMQMYSFQHPPPWIICKPVFSSCHSRCMVQAFIKRTIFLLHMLCGMEFSQTIKHVKYA